MTDGVGLVQARGVEVIEMRPGQTIHTPPGERHWHGAALEHFKAHLAMWEACGTDEPDTTWGEHVSNAEYLRGHHS